MNRIVPIYAALIFGFLSCGQVWGAHGNSTGVIQGTVTDPTGAVISQAIVRLTCPHCNTTLKTDLRGHYKFSDVPLGRFDLYVEAPGFASVTFAGDLKTAAPLIHDVRFIGVATAQQITITASSSEIESSGTYHDLDEDQIGRMTSGPPNRAMSAVVESVPGVVPEENGRLHVRGSEAQPQYVLDGVPLADNLSGTFSTELDTENLRSAQIITGNVPAEFGGKPAAIININTKSGLEMPWMGSFSISGGSFGAGALDAEVGGHARNFGVFATADVNRSDRFLDPPEIQNLHNRGGLAHLFVRTDWAASKRDYLRLTLSTNGSNFEVPNLLEQQNHGQDQRQQLRDDYAALTWDHTFHNNASAEVSLFRRSSDAQLQDPKFTGRPFFLEQHRRQRSEGLRASAAGEWKSNSLKTGVEVRRVPLAETFTLAVTDPRDVDPEEPVNAFTLSNPFRFHEHTAGVIASWFVQDHVRLGEHLTADVGVRFDHADVVVHDSAASPRVGLAYRVVRTNTLFHASYNRLFQTPPLENLLLSSSPAASVLMGDPTLLRAILPERQNHYEFGVQQQLGNSLKLGVVHYVKNIRNFSDDEQLFETAIVFPVALARADVRGTEVRVDVGPTHGLRGYVSYANSRATVTPPLVGGLLLGNESELVQGGQRFAGDQDERNEAQFGASYTHRSGLWGVFGGRYDSGIPSDFDPADFPTFDPQIRNQLDPVKRRIRPRTVLDISGGVDLFRESRHQVSLQAGISNLTNRFYLYNFQSIFSGTHIGRPREIVARMTFHWKARN